MKTQRAVLLLILVATACVFATLWSAGPLTWDDGSNIFNNPNYISGRWADYWLGPYFGLYVPVTSFVWHIVYTLAQGDFWPFRALNLVLHLSNVFLVFLLLRSLSARWKVQSQWGALIGTVLFAFHPLQIEAVAWISGGRDLLSAFFALLAIYFYFKTDKRRSFIFATLFFVLALLSKPSAVVLPLVIALADFILRPESVKSKTPRLLIWGALSLWTIYQTLQAQAVHIPSVEWYMRPWIVLDTYAFYLRGLLWPWPLSANYARTPEYVLSHSRTLIPAAAFLTGVLGFSIWAWRRDRRALGALWVWILLLAPVSGILSFAFQKISTTADHYHYLAMAAVAAGAVWLTERLSRWHRPVYAISAAVAVILFCVTVLRVPVWSNDEVFFKDMASYAPHSYSAAIGMSIVMCQDLKEYAQGVEWTEVALKERPNDISALANQAYCHFHSGNHFRVTELDFYLDQMNLRELEQSQPTAYSSLLASIGTSEIELKEFEKGFQYLCEAYRVMPSNPNHARNVQLAGVILKNHGLDPVCETDEATAEDVKQLLQPPSENGEEEP